MILFFWASQSVTPSNQQVSALYTCYAHFLLTFQILQILGLTTICSLLEQEVRYSL